MDYVSHFPMTTFCDLLCILNFLQKIRLKGVGKTAHIFYRRMRTLFFSDSCEEDYQSVFMNGTRRRKSTSIVGDAAAAEAAKDPSTSTSNPKSVQIERATTPEQPAIYIIDNFLTDSELDYFDQKISSISFERSFVDNTGYDDDENDDSKESEHVADKANASNDSACKDQNQSQKQAESLPSVCNENDNGSTSKTNPESPIGMPKTKKKVKKRKRRTIVDDSHRTSTFYSFRKLHDSKISALEQRIADTLGCWVHQIEAIQLVRYLPGQFFGIHHDLGNLLEDDTVELPRKNVACKRRLVTIFCYLNSLGEDEGGCTYFPKCDDLRVKPKRGRAVLWCNITQDGQPDSRTIHAGEAVRSKKADETPRPVTPSSSASKADDSERSQVGSKRNMKSKITAGTKKYGLNIWICEE